MYKLVSENLSNLGGPMGTEYTFDNWEKYFTDVYDAAQYAEKDYGDKIDWIKESNGYIRSPDLGYVMYRIKKIKVEK